MKQGVDIYVCGAQSWPMSQTIFSTALGEAARYEGSTKALADKLHVPENTLGRWMSGKAEMPLRAFYKLLDLIAQHERKPQASSGSLDIASAGMLSFKIAHALAQCPQCGESEFARADPAQPLKLASRLRCVSCGAEVIHRALITQFAEQVSFHSRRHAGAKHKAA